MATVTDIVDYVAGDTLEIIYTVLATDGSVFPDLNIAQSIVWKLAQVTPLGIGASLLTKGLGSGVTLLNAQAGTVGLLVASGEIKAIGAMEHELIVTTSTGDVYTVSRGILTASQSI